ncbi:class I SAM-dependent methyltransferase [Plantactinospora sp. S1510]|uniref:Class I SAM-dependent methyltransferase n=1 Tax=Plantactinospora alkalitolerans TaxID=2789879 RepID=A0ABS0H3K7_9ACTN|nr:class I SAM-dependent methyltransferase [Plantactinospora alkalitolerans]MBF9132702.1 class I SAM-dependent methyltransferase [Plantactinospora alkalitolerans]
MVDQTHALSFGAAATAYDRYRPSYPEPAVAWAIDRPSPARVVDLGAGTGILTREVLALGHHAVPVEPDPEMRAQLAAATPGVVALAGTAEQVPLPDGSVDAIVAGQAYHWFDHPVAHAEGARLLRPGGTYAALFNERDESESWVAALTALTVELLGGRGIREDGAWMADLDEAFEPVERVEFRHQVTHSPETLVGMITTRSHYITATEQRQREVDAAIRELAASHPDLAGRETFPLPYRTLVFRARRR